MDEELEAHTGFYMDVNKVFEDVVTIDFDGCDINTMNELHEMLSATTETMFEILHQHWM